VKLFEQLYDRGLQLVTRGKKKGVATADDLDGQDSIA
jgi:hypothetical protein